MTYLTPELLAQPAHYLVEDQHAQPLFEAVSTPLERISAGNYRQLNGEFNVTQLSLAEVSESDIMTNGITQSYETAPFADVRISSIGLLRILRDKPHSPRIALDVAAYTAQTSEHSMRWVAPHYVFHPETLDVPPEVRAASISVETQGFHARGSVIVYSDTSLAPKWLLGREHLQDTSEPDEVSRSMDGLLGDEFGANKMTFGEYRAALWIAEVIDKNFPPLMNSGQ